MAPSEDVLNLGSEAPVTLNRLFEIACDNAQRRNVTKDWGAFWWAMDRINVWYDWMDRTARR